MCRCVFLERKTRRIRNLPGNPGIKTVVSPQLVNWNGVHALKPIKAVHLVWILGVWAVTIALGGWVLGEQDSGDQLANRFGPVPWNHELHARQAVRNCQICHHKSKAGTSDPQACSECHTKPDVSDSIFAVAPLRGEVKVVPGEKKPKPRRVAFHKSCQGCHKAVGKGPTSCRDCHQSIMVSEGGGTKMEHITYAVDHDLACTRCHEENRPTLIPGDAWEDCASCHDGAGHLHQVWPDDAKYDHSALFKGKASEVVWDHRAHKSYELDADGEQVNCLSCHHQEQDTDPQEYRKCGDCHKERDGAMQFDGKAAPSRADALHKVCLRCHNAQKEQPEEIPGNCHDCHRTSASNRPTDFGIATWSHNGHAQGLGDDCTVCHHTDEPDSETMTACRSCHFEAEASDFAALKHSTNTTCITCHEQESVEGIPAAQWKNIQICDACHQPVGADREQSRATFVKKHSPLQLKNVIHEQCWACHKQEGKGPQAGECRVCHALPRSRQMVLQYGDDSQPLKEKLNHLAPDTYNTHRLHVDAGGFPCADCHHNMKPSEEVTQKLAKLVIPEGKNCNSLQAKADDCLPGKTAPQHCANCHDNPELSLPQAVTVRKTLCNDCHTEFGLEAPVK